MNLWGRSAIIAIVIAGIVCLPFFDYALWTENLIPFAFPGIVFSMAVANNVHAFSAWLVFIGNVLFYTLVIAFFILIFRKLRAR